MYFRPAFTIIVTTIIVTTLLVADASTFAPAYATFDCVRAIDPFIATMAISASAQRVIRVCELPLYLGLKKSQIAEAIKAGWLHPFTPLPGARAKVVTEAEVIALQQRGMIEAAAAATAPVKEIAPNRKGKLARAAAASEQS
jgi:hypothetical protein